MGPVRLVPADPPHQRVDQVLAGLQPGTGDGVAAPDGWKLQYWDGTAWADVTGASAHGTSTTAFNTVTFDPVTTSRMRATVSANTNGTTYSAVAITEWRVFADEPATAPVTVTAQSRCIGGKAYVAVNARNDASAPMDVELVTAYGKKAFDRVAAGGNAYQSFPVRAAAVPAGTATANGVSASYTALTC